MSRAIILMYHQVDIPISDLERRFCIVPCEFRRQIAWLARSGYRFVSLFEMLNHVTGNQILPEKSIHITFDDGFVGVLEHAWPILREWNIPATLFALPGHLGKTNEWMWRRSFPKRALLSGEQLYLLAQEGMNIGSHTCTHPRLPEIPIQQAKQEILHSKQKLETLLGQEVTSFAYPYGLVNDQIRDLVEQCGYRCACSTRSGFNRPGEDRFLLRRIDVFGSDHLWQFHQKLTFGINESSRLQPLTYYAKRLATRLGIQ